MYKREEEIMTFDFTVQDVINLIFVAIGIGVCFLCLLQITVSDHLRKEIRRYFQVFFTMILLYITAHLVRQLMDGVPGAGVTILLYSVTYIELMAAGFMSFMMSVCVLVASKVPKEREFRLRLVLLVFLVVHVFIVTLGQINGFIYSFDEMNNYSRENLYILSNIGPLLMLLYDSSLLIKYRKNMSKRVKVGFWMFIVAPLFAMLVQTITYGIQFIIFATVSAAVYMFTVIIEDINETYEKQQVITTRLATELSMATDIQASQLPRLFPAFPSRVEFDLYASMTPAKEVGGDFYDFFLIDDDHIALVMADVSGKGVPAALFMMIARVLIKAHMQNGETPAQALNNVNAQLCEGNDAHLFVTVWLAVLEISTGKGVAVNAGHEHPVLRRADGNFELVVYRHSPAVAALKHTKYKEHEFELKPGDSLFVYTDGVPEANNAKNELLGNEKMLEALNKSPDASPKEVLDNVMDGINAFVKGAEQFDDITMMCLKYNGVKENEPE